MCVYECLCVDTRMYIYWRQHSALAMSVVLLATRNPKFEAITYNNSIQSASYSFELGTFRASIASYLILTLVANIVAGLYMHVRVFATGKGEGDLRLIIYTHIYVGISMRMYICVRIYACICIASEALDKGYGIMLQGCNFHVKAFRHVYTYVYK